ncbi:MAG: FAD-dependent oxidoreductase [Shewanellaceae bacterium]|nr:FAD-dependent oxidoreductase [Shewanellaceae bacterium]
MKNIAIIGSGIAGMTCAYLLNRKHRVQVFEKNDYIGGHTATVTIPHQGQQLAIDTGFIVFNNRTYPRFIKLLHEWGVAYQPTEMSFSVYHAGTGMMYNGHTLNTLFADRSNLFKRRFWGMIGDILRFNSLCRRLYSDQIPDINLGQFLDQHRFSHGVREHYIYPMIAAIWSSNLADADQLDLRFFIQFFYHHGLLQVWNRPQWYVIQGGSKTYMEQIHRTLSQPVELNAELQHIERTPEGILLHFGHATQRVDEVILACHADEALALLADPSPAEQRILGGIPFQNNEVVLHTDTSLLPPLSRAWASWNYRLDRDRTQPAAVTYNMNILQGLKTDTTFCVSLNQTDLIRPEHILRRFQYTHPVLNQASLPFQQARQQICGQRHTHYVGAYWYQGFHEDGVHSAVDVTARLGVTL